MRRIMGNTDDVLLSDVYKHIFRIDDMGTSKDALEERIDELESIKFIPRIETDNEVISIKQSEGLSITHRKEHKYNRGISLVCFIDGEIPKIKEVITVRFYPIGQTVYCCVWINMDKYSSGSGYARGGGYCKSSAAFDMAIRAAGVKLKKSVDGRGLDAVEDALLTIANHYDLVLPTIIRNHG